MLWLHLTFPAESDAIGNVPNHVMVSYNFKHALDQYNNIIATEQTHIF